MPRHHNHGSPRRVAVLGLYEHAEHGALVSASQPGLLTLPPTRAEVPGVDFPFGSPLSDGFPLSGLLQLAATGDLLADDPAAHDGSDPGQPGALHPGPLRILWLLPMSVP